MANQVHHEFLTVAQVLDYLQIQPRVLYRLLKAGRIPGVRVGKQWRFRKSDLEAWLAAQTAGPRAVDAVAVSTAPVRPVPESSQAAVSARSSPQPRSAGHQARILAVEDEPEVRQSLVRILEIGGYQVDEADDGETALDLLRHQPEDLLVTDLRMSGLDGLALVREARRLYPKLPVIIVTGYSSEQTAIEAINLGVDGYLTKPFRAARVLAAVAKALGESVALPAPSCR